MKKRQIIVYALILIVAAGAFFGIKSYAELKKYQKQVEDINISEVDLSKVPDGTYTGSCEVIWVAAEVKVTVKDHRITEIELTKHENGKGKPAEIITDKVVEAQSLKVDVITGATSSSKVILKAIQNALDSAVGR